MLELGSIIGSGIAINEAVPCVFGILVATGGKALESIRMGANIGNDTDTVATMTGAIAGAMCGYKVFPDDWIRQIDKVNNIDICLLANAILQNYYE